MDQPTDAERAAFRRGVRETIERSSSGARVEDEPAWTPEQVERVKAALARGLRGLFIGRLWYVPEEEVTEYGA